MMKKTLLSVFLCAISVAVLREGGRQAIGDTAATGIAFLITPIDNSISGLDARDAQNHPLKAPIAQQSLEDLFRQNLVELTVFAAPHGVTQTENWIDVISSLFLKSIYTRVLVLVGLFQDTCLPQKERFVHNVHNLCTTFFVGIFAAFAALFLWPAQRASCRINLRC